MTPRNPAPVWAAALAGLTAAAVAVGVGQLAAGVIGGGSSPVVAVGGAAVDLSPAWLKNWAIATFGENDKVVLIGGIFVVIALLAAGFGVLARIRVGYGRLALLVFGVLGAWAAATRPDAGMLDVLPSLLAAWAGAATLSALFRRLEPAADERDAAVSGHEPEDDAREGAGDEAAPDAPPFRLEQPPVMLAGDRLRTIDRRRLFTGIATGAGVAAVTGAAGVWLGGRNDVAAERAQVAAELPKPAKPLPPLPAGADFKIPNLSPFVTPNHDFYRVDTALALPSVDSNTWSLKIHGMVDRPIELSFAELLKRPIVEADVTLACVSNPVGGPYVGNARWLGVAMAGVLREAGIKAGADMLLSTSADGWTAGTPVEVVMDGRDALFAFAMNGEPLPVAHGFPVRQVVPGLYGYVSATKWVVDVNVTRFDQERAYWTDRGWDAKGPIKTQSRIDTPRNKTKPGRNVVAGVAWAQTKGIAKVEVRVDDGPWQVARLAEVPGLDTWRQWTIEVDLTSGLHTLSCRATDETGETQTSHGAPPEPNGATGYHRVLIETT
ncbi:molybdopterin-dependent oxidoreductase [Herbidospora yilanensis]|uniref:molybdopterin-dependent oxidoreductase n=1 Tax=Herbidospora yilanensis TaxID=354426 RepID=UPI000A05A1A0|nr:molybdopterin-dependent oxidoreductase [Herbidospora yilanensis]